MLNKHLSEEELHASLAKFLESYNFLFSQLEPDRDVSIFRDKSVLARLHHSLNLEKYQQKTFRSKLLLGASDDGIVEFAKCKNMRYDTLEETRKEAFRERLASFQWGDNDDTRNFVRIFGYEEWMIPLEKPAIRPQEDVTPPSSPFKQLKDYQSKMVFKTLTQVNIANSRFLIHMPTGSGKTRVAMEVISHFLNEKDSRQVIWLADKRELCEQAMDAFLNVWSHLGRRMIRIYRVWGHTDVPRKFDGTTFVVAMYQKIRNDLDSRPELKVDLIVPDEAHSAIAPTYLDVIQKLIDRPKKQTRIMGLTATHGRGSSGLGDSDQLARFFHSKVIDVLDDDADDDVGTIEYLQKKHVLARCKREQLDTNISYTLTKEEWDALHQSFEHDFPDNLLQKIANDNKRNLLIIRKLLEMAKTYKHVIVFCGSVNQSKLLSSFMTINGEASAYIDGNSPEEYRRDVVEKFKAGTIKFLFNYRVFAAGFDSPNIDAVVITIPTKSVVLYGQMIGRGMRGTLMGGTHQFTLVDVVDDIITEGGGLDNVYDYFSDYWDNA